MAEILRRRLARDHRLDLSGRRQGDALRGLRHGYAGLDEVAVTGDELALRVEVEGAVAGVGRAAVRQADSEEAVTAHGDVVFLLGRGQISLNHYAGRRGGLHAGAELDAGGCLRVLV